MNNKKLFTLKKYNNNLSFLVARCGILEDILGAMTGGGISVAHYDSVTFTKGHEDKINVVFTQNDTTIIITVKEVKSNNGKLTGHELILSTMVKENGTFNAEAGMCALGFIPATNPGTLGVFPIYESAKKADINIYSIKELGIMREEMGKLMHENFKVLKEDAYFIPEEHEADMDAYVCSAMNASYGKPDYPSKYVTFRSDLVDFKIQHECYADDPDIVSETISNACTFELIIND